MPAQERTSRMSVDNMLRISEDASLERSDSLRELKPVSGSTNIESLDANTDKSSWNILKKLFKESKPNPIKRQDALNDNDKSNGLTRRFSIDQTSSPTFSLRRDSTSNRSSIRRKTSTGGSRKTRKFSTVNSQENLLHYAVAEEDLTILAEVLEQRKVDLNHMRPPGLSALHEACVTGFLDAIQLLLLHGADINLKTSSGLSSLQIATIFGHFDVAQFLIQMGASSKEIQDGFTPDVKMMSMSATVVK